MKSIRTFFAAALLVAIAAFASDVSAQGIASRSQVQQTSQHLDAAVGVQSVAGAVNTLATLTIPAPGAGLSIYVSTISFQACSNGTGTAQNNVALTSTNLGGWTAEYSIAATASICQQLNFSFPTGLKAAAANTAVTIVSPAAATNVGYGAQATYWSAP